MLHKISMVLVLLATTACMKIKKKGDEDAEPVAQAVTADSVSDGFDFQYEQNEDQTQVVFHIPQTWGDSLVVNKSKGDEKIFQHQITVSKSLIWKDDIIDDAKINYKFFQKVGDQLVLLKEIEILPVFDLNLNEDFKLNEMYAMSDKIKKIHFRHLVLHNQGRIFIGAFAGKIEVENLTSEQGSIQTFLPEGKALQGDGRSVGNFSIEVANGEGDLHLNLFAESGADGKDGAEPDAKLVGETGGEGDPAEFSVAPQAVCFEGGCPIGDTYNCIKDPKEGHQGGRGKRGYPGDKGGDGGSVNPIQVTAPPSVHTLVMKKAGVKGTPGQGGAGGDGGPGGPGGDGGLHDLIRFLKLDPNISFGLSIARRCNAAKSGGLGGIGAPGSPGAEGKDGVVY